MSDATQGILASAIVIFMSIGLWCGLSKKETELCIWCVGFSLILSEVIF